MCPEVKYFIKMLTFKTNVLGGPPFYMGTVTYNKTPTDSQRSAYYGYLNSSSMPIDLDNMRRSVCVYHSLKGDDNKQLDSIIHADSAIWMESLNRWSLMNGIQYKYIDNTIKAIVPEKELTDRLEESYETFQNNVVNIAEVDSHAAKIYINHLRRTGLPYNEALAEYYKKFAFPAIVFIVVFLSIGLSGKSRKNVLLISLSLSVSAAVLFYVLQMITMLLSKFGYISPFMGAWFPVFLFIVISIVLLHYART